MDSVRPIEYSIATLPLPYLVKNILYLHALLYFQLKTSVDQKIKAKDEEITKKMGISADAPGPPKSPKPKGKKGK